VPTARDTPRLPEGTSIAAWAIAAVTILVAGNALFQAADWYDRPIAGVLLNPDGMVSSVGMPSWSGIQEGLRFPDRVLSIDGKSLTGGGHARPGAVWDATVEAAALHGARFVHARVMTSAGARDVTLLLRHLDAQCWWLYGGFNIFTGALYALAAVIALRSGSQQPLARSFARFSAAAALFFLTFFDFHTSRTMVPLFFASFAYTPFAVGALALQLPDDVRFVARRPWILGALRVGGTAMAALIVGRDVFGFDVAPVQVVCTLLLGVALLGVVATMGVRYVRARGTRRATIGVLFRAMSWPYLLVGVGVLATSLSSRGSVTAFFAIPAMALAPIAVGVAFVRHDLWGSRALLSRVLTGAVATTIACVVAVGVGAAFATSLGVPFRGALVAAAAGAFLSAGLVNYVTRGIERSFFPAATEYKPTIAQLSEELTSITGPQEVGLAVERTVRRWLPCERVEFREHVDPASGDPSSAGLPGDLRIPATFGGRTLGVLFVGPKRGGALLTTDDVDLLATIANQAGLALAHAHSYAELERRRREQAAAWHTERVALVETVAAEIAHEVRYPINFFRSVFHRKPGDTTLESEEIDIGREEVDRLERLVSGLRRLVGHRIERRTVAVSTLASRAEMLLRDELAGRSLDVDVPSDALLRCDSDQITQVLVNLVSNAIDACGARGHIGVQWSVDDEGADLVVWDDGPGFEDDPSRLFQPWFTTKPRGTGLGLAITQRIVRAHGWGIDADRTNGRTRFVVTVPVTDVVVSEGLVGRETADTEAGDPRSSLRTPGGDHEDTHR
jgi:signal transduction histidine kinase